jgi:hypothetical protein
LAVGPQTNLVDGYELQSKAKDMPFSEQLKLQVRRKAHFKCCLCHALGVEIHHIIPQAEGGVDTEDNAAPLCPSCHDIYGANPEKRKFIRESRDFWYELCERRFAQGTGLIARFEAVDNRLDGSEAARPDNISGLNVLDFSASEDQVAEFSGILSPAYRGTGIKVLLHFAMSSATVGVVYWNVSIRRNLISDRNRSYVSTKSAPQNCSPIHRDNTNAEIMFADGLEMDHVSAGDPFLLHVERKATDPNDTAAGDAEFVAVEVFESTR